MLKLTFACHCGFRFMGNMDEMKEHVHNTVNIHGTGDRKYFVCPICGRLYQLN